MIDMESRGVHQVGTLSPGISSSLNLRDLRR
jgi:hypothetical protein